MPDDHGDRVGHAGQRLERDGPERHHEGGALGRLARALGHHHGAHGHQGRHGHHGRVDDALESSERGIWALKVSLLGLGLTALLQAVIALLSGSAGLLADTIHNLGDAATSIPLWIAFALVRRGASRRYTYGYGRAEDIAGAVIVGVIGVSAAVSAYESAMKLLHPRPVEHLGWVAAAALIGFLGNEAVSVFRIRVGREIGSAALEADGQHARVDGFTSLAVLVGAAGVALGVPILDPLVGLGITAVILLIVKDAAVTMWHRLLDGIEPEILEAVERAPLAVPGVVNVHRARARWLGHRVHADLHVTVDPQLSVARAHEIVDQVHAALARSVPAFGEAHIHVCPSQGAAAEAAGRGDLAARSQPVPVPLEGGAR